MTQGVPQCVESERLLDRYQRAVRDWKELNTKLGEAALSYEADIFTHLMGKCATAMGVCNDTRHAFRDHFKMAHKAGLV